MPRRSTKDHNYTHKPARYERIAAYIQEKGIGPTSVFSAMFNVSGETIRRDFKSLLEEKEGVFEIYNGGLRLSDQSVRGGGIDSNDFMTKMPLSHSGWLDNMPLARAIAGLIRDDQVVLMNGGKTLLQVAHCLPLERRVQVITNSPSTALAFAHHPHIEVVIIGNRLKDESLIPIGQEAYRFLSMTRADLCVLATCFVDAERGVTVKDIEDAELKRAMVACCSETAIVVNALTLGMIGPYIITPTSSISYMIIGDGVPNGALELFATTNIKIIHAHDKTT